MAPDITFNILTDHGDSENFARYRIPIRLQSSLLKSRLFDNALLRPLRGVALGFKMWWASVTHNGTAVIVTYGSLHGLVLAALQYLAKPFIAPRTHVMFDMLLERRRLGLLGLFDRIKMFFFEKAVDQAVVWGEPDIDAFSKEYDVPREKFVQTDYHTTLDNFELDIRDDQYIFAGGNTDRDYGVLIEAVGTIDFPVFIATQLPGVSKMAAAYPHITVCAVDPQEFREKMARCTIVAEAHPRNCFRTCGHQTFLNAMWMGKPMILADERSALGYLEDSKDALVVEAGDVEGLNIGIRQLLDNPDIAARIGRAAHEKARQPKYRTLNHMQRIYNLALRIDMSKRNLGAREDCINLY